MTIDNTAPALSTLQMFDVDADGRVDRVQATFNETLTAYSAPATVWTLANAPGGAGNTLASVAVASPVATLTLNEGNVNTASGTFTVALAANANGDPRSRGQPVLLRGNGRGGQGRACSHERRHGERLDRRPGTASRTRSRSPTRRCLTQRASARRG